MKEPKISPNAHWTQKNGMMVPKLQFRTLNEVLEYLDENDIDKDVYHPYVCPECGQWHIGHHRNKMERK